MTILERFRIVICNCSFNMWICGLEVLEKDFKWINARLAITVATVLAYGINSAYTCLTNSFEVTLQWLAIFSFATQSLPKLWVVFHSNQDLIEIVNDIDDLYNNFMQKRGHLRMYAKLEGCVNGLSNLYTAYAVCSTLGLLIIMAYPLFMYFLDGGLHTALPIFIPFLDRETTIGYALTFAYHFISVCLVCNFTLALDILFFCAVAGYALQVEQLCEMKLDLNEFLASTEAFRHKVDWAPKVRKSLVDIVHKHQHTKRLIARLNDLFFFPITHQMSTAVVSLAVSLFLIITTTWYAVYACIIGSFVQLIIFSIMGAVIKAKNEDIMAYIYEIKWNLMPVNEQKLFVLLLAKSQRPQGLAIAGIYPLEMETLVKIFKTIYSLVMVLMEKA